MSINTSCGSSGKFLTTVSVSMGGETFLNTSCSSSGSFLNTVSVSIAGETFLNFPNEPGERARSLGKNFRPKCSKHIILATLQASIGAIAKAGLVGEELLQRQTNWTWLVGVVTNLRRSTPRAGCTYIQTSRGLTCDPIRRESGSKEETAGTCSVETPKRSGIRIRAITAGASDGCPPTTGEENQLIARRCVARR